MTNQNSVHVAVAELTQNCGHCFTYLTPLRDRWLIATNVKRNPVTQFAERVDHDCVDAVLFSGGKRLAEVRARVLTPINAHLENVSASFTGRLARKVQSVWPFKVDEHDGARCRRCRRALTRPSRPIQKHVNGAR